MDKTEKLFSVQKSGRVAWPLAVGTMVVASFVAMGVIWQGVNAMERVRVHEHEVLMDNIAQTSQFFLSDEQNDYFYRIVTLLTRISFIENIGVYQNNRRILQAGNGEISRLDQFPQRSLNPATLYLARRLMDDDPHSTEIRAAFSLRELQEPKRAIMLSFGVSALLLIAVSLLVGQLYFYHRRMLETERIKTHMINSINHDAGHDLTIIHAKLLQILKRSQQPFQPEIMEKDLKSALESTESMVRFLNNLKDQKRLGTGNVELLPEALDLSKLIQSVSNSFREKLSIRKMRLDFVEPAGVLIAWADPQIVKRVLMNLIHNAMKYSPAESVITLVARSQDGVVRLTIQDQGLGIAQTHWTLVFEPYWQVNPDSQGIGLGLYISRQFIRMSCGELGISDSRAGQGTTFYFTLPEKKH